MSLKVKKIIKPKKIEQKVVVSTPDWHKKIAKNRGASWHKNMLKGRVDASLNPSKVRIARLTKNFDQSAIAKRVELSDSTYGAIERGKRLVDELTANKISKMLGKPLATLFTPTKRKKFVAILIKNNL